MKTIQVLILAIALLLSTGASFAQQKDGSKKKKAKVETVQFKITGMTCEEGCAKGIESSVYRMKGIKSSSVNYETQIATVIYDPNKVGKEEIKKTIEAYNPGEGGGTKYQANEIKNEN